MTSYDTIAQRRRRAPTLTRAEQFLRDHPEPVGVTEDTLQATPAPSNDWGVHHNCHIERDHLRARVEELEGVVVVPDFGKLSQKDGTSRGSLATHHRDTSRAARPRRH